MRKIKKKIKKNKRKSINPVARLMKGLTDGFNRSVSTSAVGRSLLNYEGEEKAIEKSFFHNMLESRENNKKTKSFKYKIQRGVENSCILHGIHKITDMLLTALMRQYGIFFFSLGLYSLMLYFLGNYAVDSFNADTVYLVLGITELICALPMLVSKKTLAHSLRESRAANMILFRLLGFSEESFQKEREENTPAGGIPFVLGFAAGLISSFVSPLNMLASFGIILGMYASLISPESGLLMIILGFPFMTSSILQATVLYLIFCYALKALRGKRVFKFELTDYAVLAFAFVLFIGSFNSISPEISFEYSFSTIIYICAYFLIVNTIKTRPWARRIIFSIIFSLIFSVILGIIQRFIVNADFILAEDIVADGLVKATFSSPTVLAQFIILFVFYLFAFCISRKMGFTRKLFCMMLCVVSVVCLYFTMTPLAMLCFIIAALIFFMLYSRKTLLFALLLSGAVGFSAYAAPVPVMNKMSEYMNLGKEELIIRAQALQSSFGLAADHIIGGSAAGSYGALYSQYSAETSDVATSTYNTYFQMSIELGVIGLFVFICIIYLFLKCNFSMFAKCGVGTRNLYSAAGVSGIVGVLFMGFSENLWQEPHFVFAFWIAMGLCMAIKRQALIEKKGYDEYLLGNERYSEKFSDEEESVVTLGKEAV